MAISRGFRIPLVHAGVTGIKHELCGSSRLDSRFTLPQAKVMRVGVFRREWIRALDVYRDLDFII